MFEFHKTGSSGGGDARQQAERRACVVRRGNTSYLLPLEMVLDCIELPARLHTGSRADYLSLGDEALPLIHLGETCEEGGEAGKTVVVVATGGQRAGLVVDAFAGEDPAEMEPLCRQCLRRGGIAGYATLGSGQVAPILDVPELVRRALGRGKPPGRLQSAA